MTLDSLLALIYPDRCPACDVLVPRCGLCHACSSSLYPLGSACPRCGEPEETPEPVTCARCLRRPPAFRRLRAPYRYGGELAVAVRRLKYGGPRSGGRRDLARPLGALLAAALAEACAGLDLVVPVPLHPRRLRARGFSQAHVLAAVAARRARVGARVDPFALVRERETAEQAGLRRQARLTNVRSAFAVPDRRRVAGAHVLLLDDVVTTGATAQACARALLAAGAAEVDVLALARAES